MFQKERVNEQICIMLDTGYFCQASKKTEKASTITHGSKTDGYLFYSAFICCADTCKIYLFMKIKHDIIQHTQHIMMTYMK